MIRFRVAFPVLVLGAIGVGLVVVRLRDDPALARFEPPPAVELTPLEEPKGDARAAGLLVDATGATLPHALVSLVAEGRPHWTYTDESGAFALDRLPAGEHEAYVLAADLPPATFAFAAPAAELTWTMPLPRPPIDTLPPIARSDLVGLIAHAALSPRSRCQVVALPAPGVDPLSGAVPRRTVSDAEGRFRISELAHGTYRLIALPPWAVAGHEPVIGERGIEHDGRAPAPWSLALACSGIHGRLADARGKPIEGATILARPADEPRALWPPVQTDDQGRFTLGYMPEGEWLVSVSTGDERRHVAVTLESKIAYELQLGPLDPSSAPDE